MVRDKDVMAVASMPAVEGHDDPDMSDGWDAIDDDDDDN